MPNKYRSNQRKQLNALRFSKSQIMQPWSLSLVFYCKRTLMCFEVAHNLTLVAPSPGNQIFDPFEPANQNVQIHTFCYLEMEAVEDVFGYVSCGIG